MGKAGDSAQTGNIPQSSAAYRDRLTADVLSKAR